MDSIRAVPDRQRTFGRSYTIGASMDIIVVSVAIFAFLAGCFYQGFKGEKPDMWLVFLLFLIGFSVFLIEANTMTGIYQKVATRNAYAEINANYTCFPNYQRELAIQEFCNKPPLNWTLGK